MTKQYTLEGTDTDLSAACEGFLKARAAMALAKNELAQAQDLLVTEMTDANKESIRHEGRLFSIRFHESNQTLMVKMVKVV